MINLSYIPLEEIRRIRKNITDHLLLCPIFSDICRINALYMIMRTGSGHIGSSFSSMDIVTWLWLKEMVNPNEESKNLSDIYFSSKGHDAPALYALLIAIEKLPFEYIHKLRRLGGLPGHPDVGTPYIAANTGSLGMGISKASGMALAKRLQGKSGKIYVLTGDGELQEGQVWESLQPSANRKLSEITAIVDNNKIQSDVYVKDTSDLGDLEAKFKSFGWAVFRCDGHNFYDLARALGEVKKINDRPQIIIADTIKGKGVSFMERLGDDGLYKFHSGAPVFEQYQAACDEITGRINDALKELGEEPIIFEKIEMPLRARPQNPQKLVAAYGDELVKIAREHQNIIAMNADLMLDTGLVPFKKEFPGRYIQCGIAEQDMVSLAGGMALSGILPVVHSFECFLSTRPNEQIYNNATEKTKIIYVGSLAGLLPGMPGHSHQSVRGISALGSIPGLILFEPADEREARMAIRWAVEKNTASTYIRISSVPCELEYQLPADYVIQAGRGTILARGRDVLIIAYGPVMLGEGIRAVELLARDGISVSVANLPWLNMIDEQWLREAVLQHRLIVTLDDHYTSFGQGTMIASALARTFINHPKVVSLGVGDIPACGENREVLAFHKLDAPAISAFIREALENI